MPFSVKYFACITIVRHSSHRVQGDLWGMAPSLSVVLETGGGLASPHFGCFPVRHATDMQATPFCTKALVYLDTPPARTPEPNEDIGRSLWNYM